MKYIIAKVVRNSNGVILKFEPKHITNENVAKLTRLYNNHIPVDMRNYVSYEYYGLEEL